MTNECSLESEDAKGHSNFGFIEDENVTNTNKRKKSECNYFPPAESLRKPRPSCVLALRKTRASTQVLAAIAANMGAFALGTVLSWTATALPSMEDTSDVYVNEDQQSWVAAIATLGAVAACPFSGFGITYFGRRKTMLIMTFPFALGWLLIFFAKDLAMLYSGRFLTGFAGGSFTITAPVFIAECSSITIRGGLASAFDLMVSTGMFFILLVGAFVPWRTQAMACGIIPFILFALLSYVPESPRYLVEQGEYQKATDALCWLYGLPREEVRLDVEELRYSVDESNARPVTFRKIIMKMSVLKPILVCLGLMLFTTMSGYDAVMFFTVDIFETAGTGIDPSISAIVLGGIQVVATIPAAFVVDKFGRRRLLMVSEFFMCLSLLSMGAYFFMENRNVCQVCTTINLSWLPLTSLTSFVIAYSVGIGPLSLMMIGELLPSHIKGLASCMVLTFRWILAFGVTKMFDDFGDDFGRDGCYWLFSGCCALGCIFVYFGIPETKGKTLDEIQLFFVSAAKLKQEKIEEEIENASISSYHHKA